MKQIENYNHKLTEKKWQKFWDDNNTFYFDPNNKSEKFYMLPMFLYPSGEMHLGHLRNFSISDVIARFKRLQGYNVLHSTAGDAFGLPAENAAIKRGIHPSEWTYKNLDKIMKSMYECGLSFDKTRVFATCDPEYYGFQQKIFIDFYKHGLAFQKESYVNWDPVDQTVLANEQVIDGRGWRSDAIVEKKKLKQWFLKITNYADELLESIKNENLKGWPEKVKLMQENWIGKSEGAMVDFKIDGKDDKIIVYTTRPDTLYGASFIGISANHPIAEELAKNNREIADFIEECKKAPVDEESLETMEKKGTPTGIFVEHPFDKNWKLPVWIANFILMDYGTGAIFACPAHDQRDYEFAIKYNLPIKQVVCSSADNILYSSDKANLPYPSDKADFPYPPDKVGQGGFLATANTPTNTTQQTSFTTNHTLNYTDNFFPSTAKITVNHLNYNPQLTEKAKELRANETPFEKEVWYKVLSNFKDLKWTKQKPIGEYIVDFYCAELMLAIEIDGESHVNKEKFESNRINKLNEVGINIVRYSNQEIENNIEGVFEDLKNKIEFLENGSGRMGQETLRNKMDGSERTEEETLKIEMDGSERIWGETPPAPPYQGGNSGLPYQGGNSGLSCQGGNSGLSYKEGNSGLNYKVSDCELPYTEEGFSINSDFLNGLPTKEAKSKAIERIEEMGIGERKINFRLRDWGVSRQRYWGCPIPMVYCEHCGVVPEKEENLPVKLPEDVVFDGKGNPLANHPTWKHTKCPKCGRPAIRETDTMDTFVDSSWYFARFVDLDKKNPVNKELCNKILPIDQYVGGIEHATMHLIYSRFFTKAMADMGYFNKNIREPAIKLFNQGMVCHRAYKNSKKEWCYPWNVKEENGKYFDIKTNEELICEGIIKMSKSKCNVVDINSVIEDYGADAARLFVLSDTPADKDFEWTTEGIEGAWKYINRIWKLSATFVEENNIEKLKNIKITKINDLVIENHKAIKTITFFLENLEFNKSIARIREFSNIIEKFTPQDEEDIVIKYNAIVNLVKMLCPFTPHLCEELNSILEQSPTLNIAQWPSYNEELTIDNEVTVVVQVNGKLRGDILIEKDLAREKVEELAKEQENVKKYIEGKEIKKVIIVPNKLVNFVIA